MLNLLAKKLVIILTLFLPFNTIAKPDYNQLFGGVSGCFMLYDVNSKAYKTIYNKRQCEEQMSPCSTFKVALSLMGFDSKILLDENTPKWEYNTDYTAVIQSHAKDHTPKTWMQNSVVWYSRLLTEKLGLVQVKDYLSKFSYGNKDMSGNPGKNDGLTSAWLTSGSSLKISATEQIVFLEKFITFQLPISKYAIEKTKEIMFLSELANGWKLYGKTGSGYQKDKLGNLNEDLQIGWFIGWIEKEKQTYIFTLSIRDIHKFDQFGGLRAKTILLKFLNELDFLK